MSAKTLSKRTRFEIFKRDGFTCQYCGRTPPEVVLHVDHVVAKSEGGSNQEDNLLTSCQDCNLGKGAVPMERIKAPMNLDTAQRQEKLDQLRAFSEQKIAEMEFETEQAMLVLEEWAKLEGQTMEEGKFGYYVEDEKSVRMFLKRLPIHEVLDAVHVTFRQCRKVGAQRFKYFCAVCWHKIKGDMRGNSVERTSLEPESKIPL